MEKYDHRAIEKKWQQAWSTESLYRTPEDPKNKRYVLDMFPYPSGAGLHVGHPHGYFGSDVFARYSRARGCDVLHPMGWDAFGLPAENYAIKTGTPPKETTDRSIERFRSQLSLLGLSFDWDREINTSDPAYYRWTQWLFLELFKRGLAYQKEAPVNWCPQDQTVLANEQVVNGHCERCNSLVEQRNLKQWFFKITEYADELVDALVDLDWPESTKASQVNWIGRSQGAEINFSIEGNLTPVIVFTTRPDTLYGVTYLVIAPESALASALIEQANNSEELSSYVSATNKKTDLERQENRQKTGVQIQGVVAKHPLTGEPIQIWLADYVIASYGTGAVMAVPAHDERDWEFAHKYNLPIKKVIRGEIGDGPILQKDVLENSSSWNGLHSERDLERILEDLEKLDIGRRVTRYRLRDWLISRQRYWGVPIPIIHCLECGAVPVPVDELPVILPTDVDFRPTGESPISRSIAFHQGVTCPQCGKSAHRESDTMDTFVDSSWYFCRYTDPSNSDSAFDREKVNKWLPVDLYIGGAEHTVLHLLYSRFVTKVLADLGYLDVREPFQKLKHQGMVIGEDGRKMSKSYGNVVNPDEIVDSLGSDTLRSYEMFMGPFSDSMPWSTSSIIGIRRWLERIWRLQEKVSAQADRGLGSVERAIDKVTNDIEAFKFNTAVSALMVASNDLAALSHIPKNSFQRFLQILAPFAPHLAQELWARTGGAGFIDRAGWPVAVESLTHEDTVTITIQVNGKVRGTVDVSAGASDEDVESAARLESNVIKYIDNQSCRVIYVPGKLISFVTTG